MKLAAITLIVTGGVLLVAGIWASLVVPVRTTSEVYGKLDGVRIEEMHRRTIWGRQTHRQIHATYPWPESKPHGEGVGPMPDEFIWGGELGWSGAKRGRWILRERNGATWEEKIEWYIDDKKVTAEEWERGK